MSSMIFSSDDALSRTISTIESCSPSRPVSCRSSSIASTPFIGVRISWLIAARKRDLASFADSANWRIRTSSACARLRSVTSI
jgi:hypothetical protein